MRLFDDVISSVRSPNFFLSRSGVLIENPRQRSRHRRKILRFRSSKPILSWLASARFQARFCTRVAYARAVADGRLIHFFGLKLITTRTKRRSLSLVLFLLRIGRPREPTMRPLDQAILDSAGDYNLWILRKGCSPLRLSSRSTAGLPTTYVTQSSTASSRID